MNESTNFSLKFQGLKNDDEKTLRRVKSILIADLELPIPTIQEILTNPPSIILSAPKKADLTKALKLLSSAGAIVELLSPLNKSSNNGSIIEDLGEEFSFELDFSELEAPRTEKKVTNTKIWQLELDEENLHSNEEDELKIEETAYTLSDSNSALTIDETAEENSDLINSNDFQSATEDLDLDLDSTDFADLNLGFEDQEKSDNSEHYKDTLSQNEELNIIHEDENFSDNELTNESVETTNFSGIIHQQEEENSADENKQFKELDQEIEVLLNNFTFPNEPENFDQRNEVTPAKRGLPINVASTVTETENPVSDIVIATNNEEKISKNNKVIDLGVLLGALVVAMGLSTLIFKFLLEEEPPEISISIAPPKITKKIATTNTNSKYIKITESVTEKISPSIIADVFSINARCKASNFGLISCTIEGKGKESPQVSNRDLARGLKQEPWLSRIEVDQFIFKGIKKEKDRVAKGMARLSIWYDDDIHRVLLPIRILNRNPQIIDERSLELSINNLKDKFTGNYLDVRRKNLKEFFIGLNAIIRY
jgi:hypothetical protein